MPTPDDNNNTSPVMVDTDQNCVPEQNHADGDSGETVHAAVIHDHIYETPDCTEEGNAQLWTNMSDV